MNALKRYKWLSFSDPTQMIKLGIWLYLILYIFEGGLRKWILPGLAAPLLIIRDPVALWILVTAYRHRMFPNDWYVGVANFIALVGVLTAMSFGHGNLFVAIYGARTIFLHFPLMFLIGSMFTRKDVEQMGRVILWIALPMALLIALQFFSPQSALVNRGVGGDMEGAGFSGSGDFYRPSGTFSFTSGLVQYFSIVAVFVLYFFIRSERISKFLMIGSAAALLIAIPLSISRSLFFNFIIELMMLVMAVSFKTRHFKKMFTLVAIGMIALFVLSQTEFFQVSTAAFTDRFETANEVEGGIESVFLDRFLGGMLHALSESADRDFFGLGIGMGSNVGAQLLYGNAKVFLISEEEWGRIIGELGPLFGLLLIFLRVHFASSMAGKAFSSLRKENFLPWMLLGVAFLILLQGQWANSTSLGFSTLIGGMLMGANNEQNLDEQ